MPVLQIEALKKKYKDGTTALNGIDLVVQPGEFIVVIGPSGAGKSTLIRCINRLADANEGKILFKGKDVLQSGRRDIRKLRREIGIVFQQFNLINRVSVLKNVLHGRLGYMGGLRGALGLYSKEDIQTAMKLLERVGLADKAHNRADDLSGGQQQRVAIARALIQKPQLMLADEPIASLDPASSDKIMRSLQEIVQRDGIPCIVNLHQIDMARKFATRVVGIRQGAKVFDGPPERLTEDMIRHIYHGAALPSNDIGVSAKIGGSR